MVSGVSLTIASSRHRRPAMALCWSGCAVTASLIESVSRAPVPTVSHSLDISAKQVRSSSRSTDRIDGPGGRKASPIPSMPIPLLELRCPALRRSCRSYVTVGWRRSERFASHDQVRSKPVARPRIRLRPSSSPLREQLRHLPSGMIIAACARLRPGHDLGDAEQATKTALRRLARRHQQLSEEIAEADHELDQLVHQVAPALLALPGVGPEVAGILAGSWFSSTARRGEDLIAAGLLMLAGLLILTN
jgi:hypothetical protein